MRRGGAWHFDNRRRNRSMVCRRSCELDRADDPFHGTLDAAPADRPAATIRDVHCRGHRGDFHLGRFLLELFVGGQLTMIERENKGASPTLNTMIFEYKDL